MNGKRFLFLAAIAALACTAMPWPTPLHWHRHSQMEHACDRFVRGGHELHPGPATASSPPRPPRCKCTNAHQRRRNLHRDKPDNVNGTVNFGTESADTTHIVNCTYEHAVNATVVSTDTNGWNVTAPGGRAPTPSVLGSARLKMAWAVAITRTRLPRAPRRCHSGQHARRRLPGHRCKPTTLFSQSTVHRRLLPQPRLVLILAPNGASGNNQTVTITFTLNLL